MYAHDSTSLCSPSESILFSDTHEAFCRKWRLVNNYPKTEQMLFNVQNTACQYPTTDINKSLGVWLDRNIKYKTHVDQGKGLNIFTWNNFNCFLKRINQTKFSIETF